MNLFRYATVLLVVALLVSDGRGADKSAPKPARVDAYPGSLKLPALGGLSLRFRTSSKASKPKSVPVNASAASQQPAHTEDPIEESPEEPVEPAKQGIPEVSQQVLPPETEDSAAIDRQPGKAPAVMRSVLSNRPQRDEPQTMDAMQALNEQKPRSILAPTPGKLKSVKVEPQNFEPLDHEPHNVEPHDLDIESSEREVAVPLRPSQFADHVRHGPIRRAGMGVDLDAPGKPHPALAPVQGNLVTVFRNAGSTVAASNLLSQGNITADDLAAKRSAAPWAVDSRGISLANDGERRAVSRAASPSSLLSVLAEMDPAASSPASSARQRPVRREPSQMPGKAVARPVAPRASR